MLMAGHAFKAGCFQRSNRTTLLLGWSGQKNTRWARCCRSWRCSIWMHWFVQVFLLARVCVRLG